MYFSKIELRKDVSNIRDLINISRDVGYNIHRLIWSFFADCSDRKRDFLYRYEYYTQTPSFYSVSERPPVDEKGIWNIENKPYNPKLRSGHKLSFMLRANAVRTKRDENNRQHRHDVVMEAKLRLKRQKKNENIQKSLSMLVQEEGSIWLAERAEKYGFTVNADMIRVDGYRQHHLVKGHGNRHIKYSTLDFSGILTVTDTERFIETLYKGIGPSKGFGCGLLLVRRV